MWGCQKLFCPFVNKKGVWWHTFLLLLQTRTRLKSPSREPLPKQLFLHKSINNILTTRSWNIAVCPSSIWMFTFLSWCKLKPQTKSHILRSIKFHMSTENFMDTQEKAQLVRDFLMDSETFRDYGKINENSFFLVDIPKHVWCLSWRIITKKAKQVLVLMWTNFKKKVRKNTAKLLQVVWVWH